jgi:hypothetical protein
VLDPQKLRQSLEGLVKRNGWERLGGRLRKNVRGVLQTLNGVFRPLYLRTIDDLGLRRDRVAYSCRVYCRPTCNHLQPCRPQHACGFASCSVPNTATVD